LEVDRGHGRRPHRARGVAHVAAGLLDRREPPDHLPRSPGVSRPARGLWGVCAGRRLPVRGRGRPARPGRRRPPRGGTRARPPAGTGRTGGPRVSASARWSLVALVAMIGVVVALLSTFGDT